MGEEIKGLGKRLKEVRTELKYTQSGISKACGSKMRSWQDYEKNLRIPGSQVMVGLANLGVNTNWVLTGVGSMLISELQSVGNQYKTDHDQNFVHLPVYDVRAAAGYGTVVEGEKIVDFLAFKNEWIQKELQANPADLYLITVDGESMEPTLRPGDLLLIDRRCAPAVPRDGIYVLRMGDSLLVKRLQRLPGNKVTATSDNSAYKPFYIDLAAPEEDLDILGRVVWSGQRA